MIQGNENLKNSDIYLSLSKPVNKQEKNNSDEKVKPLVRDLFNVSNLKVDNEISTQNLVKLYTEVEDLSQPEGELTNNNNTENTSKKNTTTPEDKVKVDPKAQKREQAYKAINNTQTAISIASTVLKATNQKGYSELIESSSAVLDASKGVIDLDNVSKSENKTKTVMSSISQVAGGVGTVLNIINIPEAEFLTFTGKVAGLGAEQQNLSENIKKKDARAIVGTSVSMVKGSWGVVVSGLETAKLVASLGQKVGIVKVETITSLTTSAAKISKVADKVAIPFAIAGTALNVWDLKNEYGKLQTKKLEIKNVNNPETITTETYKDSKTVKSKDNKVESLDEKKERLNKELKVLDTNTKFRALSTGLSIISTTALIASLAYPSFSKLTGIVAVGGSITSSIAGTLSKKEKRDSFEALYQSIKKNSKYAVVIADSYISGLKPNI